MTDGRASSMTMEPTSEQIEDAAALWKALGFVGDRHGQVRHLAINLAIRDQAHAARISELETGIKRLSEEEEACGESLSVDDAFNLVRMAAKLSEHEKANVAYVDANTLLIRRVEALEAENDKLKRERQRVDRRIREQRAVLRWWQDHFSMHVSYMSRRGLVALGWKWKLIEHYRQMKTIRVKDTTAEALLQEARPFISEFASTTAREDRAEAARTLASKIGAAT